MNRLARPAPLIVAAIIVLALFIGASILVVSRGSGDPPLTTAQALAQACSTIANEDYDQVRTIRHADGSSAVLTYSHSSADFHGTGVGYASDGTTVVAKSEEVFKDGTWYVRASVSSQDVETLFPWVIRATNLHPVFPKGCSGDVQVSGAVGVNEDTGLRHLVWDEEASFPGERDKWELWVDPDGRPVRGLVTVYEVVEESTDASGASGSSGSSPTPIAVYTIEETYSGFGETNTITAPIDTPTPTPPTPTSVVPT